MIDRRLAVTVLLAALVLDLISALAFFAMEFQRHQQQAASQLQQLLDTVEQTAAVAASLDNAEMGAEVMERLLRNDAVFQVRLDNGRNLHSQRNRPLHDTDALAMARQLRAPNGGGAIVGTLSLSSDFDYVFRQSLATTLLGAGNSTVLIGVTVLMALVIVRRSLLWPLLRVSDTLHAVAAGEQERLPLLSRHRDDELGRLVEDINRLLDRLQERSAAQHAMLSNALNHVEESVFVIDRDAGFHYVNDGACRALGYRREELMALTVFDIDPVFPREAWLDLWQQIRASRSVTFETRHRARDGRVYPVEIIADPFEFEGISYSLALGRDITARKQAESELERYRHHLEDLVAERTAELAGAKAVAES
ncbi:MAG: PAS domain S-box protein, partial [Methylococcaceae bacterium]|nr:PAS domain S-box protein [Methylococcaceae bacterium]